MIPVDAQTLREVAPHFTGEIGERQAAIVAAVGEVLASMLEEYKVDTRLRIAHFLGQTCHESAGFRTTEEFSSGEQYEGRVDLGNTKPGDGPRFKGRGLLQLTGRDNYRRVGKIIGVDLENDPLRAAEPVLSLRIACEFWKNRKINLQCDGDNLVRVTELVNGGTNGIDERRLFTSRAKAAVTRIEGLIVGGSQPGDPRPVLRRGSKGDDVVRLQTGLQKLGFMVAIDGDFGPGTEVAVARFQRDQVLDIDGIVGQATWDALAKALKAIK